jgi:hypothetical protein
MGRTAVRVATAALALAVCLVPALGASAARPTNSPNPSATYNALDGVAATSSTDAWAVGEYETTTGAVDNLILHWNGTTWSQVKSPNPSTLSNRLYAVSATSSTDAWAVGDYEPGTGSDATQILHWNGTKWSKVKSPTAGSSVSDLYGVSATSTSDAWAVGIYRLTSGVNETLVAHWNGTKWSKVKSPDPSTTDNYLYDVSAGSSSSAWAVGDYCAAGCGSSPWDTMTLRWNGTKWKTVSSPDPSSTVNDLDAVNATSSTSALAVGAEESVTTAYDTLGLVWNGTTWSGVASSSPGSTDNYLVGVSATSPTSAWAVGQYCSGTCATYQSLIENWNGTSWSSVASPNPGSAFNTLIGVSAVSSTDAWAVGQYETSSGVLDTLIAHWDGSTWAQI